MVSHRTVTITAKETIGLKGGNILFKAPKELSLVKRGYINMSESMETGGFGKNPAIDKINHLNSISSHMNAVSELEKKVFEPIQKSVLQKRKEIADKFQISFKKKGEKQKYEPILHRGERKLSTEQYPVRFSESGQDRFAIRTARGVFPGGRRQTAQILPTKGMTGNNLGEQRWRTDTTSCAKMLKTFAFLL